MQEIILTEGTQYQRVPTHTSRFTHSQIVPDLLWVPSIFQTVLGFFNWSFPILSLFRSLLLMKLSVTPESMRTCLSVVECEDFNRVGICSDLNLLENTIFDSSLRRRAQTDRVAIFKNLLQDQPTFLFQLPTPDERWFLCFLF